MPDINPLVVDLSHWDPAYDYEAVVDDGIVGVIYKATEGKSYTDPTYVPQQQAAKGLGLKWGAFHFANSDDVSKQINNFLTYACPDPDELFCLDWEDNGGNVMPLNDAKTWITEVEAALKRPGECVLYSGNTAKEALGDTVDPFFGQRRLWLCHYSETPSWQRSWETYWLWQFTDGIVGSHPHDIEGIGPCDINSYDHGPDRLMAEWASGRPDQPSGPSMFDVVNVLIGTPPGVQVKIRQFSLGRQRLFRPLRREHEAR